MKTLSLNLCASWTSPRRTRLEAVAEYVKSEGIDLLLVQEGVRSCFVYNMIRQLAGMLNYDHFSKSVFGWPFFWESRVGVLSAFKILRTNSVAAEVPQKDFADAIPLPWRRRAVAATVDAPGLGLVTAISVHLTSSPATFGYRAKQLAVVDAWKASLPPRDVTIFGGDFNTYFPYDKATGFGVSPDYIFVEGARITRAEAVLTGQVVTDHPGGVLVEVQR